MKMRLSNQIPAERPRTSMLVLLISLLILPAVCYPTAAQQQDQSDPAAGVLDPLKHSLARLASPGMLAGPHRELDHPEKCSLCHSGVEGLDQGRCLECHKEVGGRLEQGSGHHGTLTGKCWDCHSDHQGREYAMVTLDEAGFDHRRALYDLLGAHRRVECRKCHDPRPAGARKFQQNYYLGLPTDCEGCHQDPHQGQFRLACATCHDERSWKPGGPGFDHDMSRFPLSGAHRATPCAGCHKRGGAPYLDLQCVSCHADPHGGQYGQVCQDCHTTGGWIGEASRVDHEKTRFPLSGAHRGVACGSCHKKGQAERPGLDCVSCHKDEHRGRFGPKCGDCHTTGGWKGRWLSADHEKTRFPLSGAHLSLSCAGCHKEEGSGRLELPCVSCHEDPHRMSVDRACERCHDAKSWQSGWPGRLDHPASRFPLDATHAALECGACHQPKTLAVEGLLCTECHTDVAEFFRGTYLAGLLADAEPDMMQGKVACADCHAADDRGADLQAILHRCEGCHPREYGDYALAWMSVVHREGRLALETAGPQGSTAADAQRYLITRITRLAPHNFLRAARMLRTLQTDGSAD